jgi:hypothetical protein
LPASAAALQLLFANSDHAWTLAIGRGCHLVSEPRHLAAAPLNLSTSQPHIGSHDPWWSCPQAVPPKEHRIASHERRSRSTTSSRRIHYRAD